MDLPAPGGGETTDRERLDAGSGGWSTTPRAYLGRDRAAQQRVRHKIARPQPFDVLGLGPVMDHGWIVTLADPENPAAQISFLTHDETASVVADASIEVSDVDACRAAAVQAGAEIVHPLTDEPWGVRRFFVRDPDGHVINVLSHP